MLNTGRALRKLGQRDMYRLLRWGPMAVADLVAEYFETELLRATIAARGIFGTFLGPWSAGSSLVLLIRAAGDEHAGGHFMVRRGGMGAVTQAMAAAAQQAGAEIRSGAEVIEVRVKDGVASGVVLSNGEEITAKAVISNADPKRTLLKLVDPAHLSPDFVMKLQHYRMPGTVAKVNLALSGLPKFTALEGENHDRALSSRIHIGPEIDYLERAFDESKYGNFSKQPYLEVAIPSLTDPSLAPEGKHVMSIYMQYAPYKLKGSDWEKQRVPLGDTVVKTLAQYAPEFARADPEPPDHHSPGPGRNLRPHRRAHLPRRTFAGPVLHHASAAGLGAISHADPESVPVRLRHPSRRGIDRRLGRQRGPRNLERPKEITAVILSVA